MWAAGRKASAQPQRTVGRSCRVPPKAGEMVVPGEERQLWGASRGRRAS